MSYINSSNQCTKVLWEKYHEGIIPVIPDIKIKSPKEGDLFHGRDPIAYAELLERVGAPVISVVTEKEHFGGSLKLMSDIAEAVNIPILQKDFITSKNQLVESKKAGAKGILIIAAIVEEKILRSLISFALEIGLEPLVEIHHEEELKMIQSLKLSFIGINNRNILEWETDNGSVETTEKLSRLMSNEVFLLSESSIMGSTDVERAMKAGAHGVLVGTALLQAEDPVSKYIELTGRWR